MVPKQPVNGDDPPRVALAHPLPEVVARIGHLVVRARGIVEGALSGQHRSPHRGSSVEFAEHKEYSPGDDPRHIDWKALAKLDKPYVKRFEEETELTAHLVIDASGSMAYRSDGAPLNKLGYAAELGCALGYLLLGQGDRVGLRLFASGREIFATDRSLGRDRGLAPDRVVPARRRRGHLGELARTLAELEASGPRGPSELGLALEATRRKAGRRALVVILSDLLFLGRSLAAEVQKLGAALGRLRARHHDVALIQVLDPAELSFPFEGPILFRGLEPAGSAGSAGTARTVGPAGPAGGTAASVGGAFPGSAADRPLEVLADPSQIRTAYLAALEALCAGVRRACAEADVTYALADTGKPAEEVLAELLRARSWRVGGRALRRPIAPVGTGPEPSRLPKPDSEGAP